MNDYRVQQLRELLEVSRRGEAKLSVQQVESLLDWDETPDPDARRLKAMIETDADEPAEVSVTGSEHHPGSPRQLHAAPGRRTVLGRFRLRSLQS
jgi:hypothetical protein